MGSPPCRAGSSTGLDLWPGCECRRAAGGWGAGFDWVTLWYGHRRQRRVGGWNVFSRRSYGVMFSDSLCPKQADWVLMEPSHGLRLAVVIVKNARYDAFQTIGCHGPSRMEIKGL